MKLMDHQLEKSFSCSKSVFGNIFFFFNYTEKSEHEQKLKKQILALELNTKIGLMPVEPISHV
jgi:hypothetical protein